MKMVVLCVIYCDSFYWFCNYCLSKTLDRELNFISCTMDELEIFWNLIQSFTKLPHLKIKQNGDSILVNIQ